MTELQKIVEKELKDMDDALWKARVASTHSSGQHTQIGHATDALHRLSIALRQALEQPAQAKFFYGQDPNVLPPFNKGKIHE